jgi:site-specific recombinase
MGVLAIGLTNLAVSFYLALSVGLKARGITFAQRWKLLQAIARRLLRQPREFLLPPKQNSAQQLKE